MELRTLGRTGLKVSPLCLGAMMFGGWGNPDHDDSIKIIHKALDSGINFIDTADVYSQGESEEIVGKALSSVDRSSVVLATKVHGQMGDDPLSAGNSRRWIMTEVENSLKRLKTDYIDLYQIHRPDESTDIEETLGALSDLVHQGKIRYFGSSTFPADQIVAAQWAAERRGYERLPHRAAALFDPGARYRARRPARRRNTSAWASCRGARWPEGGSPANSVRARRTPVDARRGSPIATTWTRRATNESSRP